MFACLSTVRSVVYTAKDPHATDSFYAVQNLLTVTLTQRFIRDYLEVFTYERQFITAVPNGHTSSRRLLIATQEPVIDLSETEPM